MSNNASQFERLAVITALVHGASAPLGRTALMKCLFFLKALRGVPLPYSFRLYTYGPFDADVLDDLRYAGSLGAVESKFIHYSGGYGYELRAGPEAEKTTERVSEFISRYQESIEWVVREFGNRSASDLEMASTLVYVDQTLAEKGTNASASELAKKVHDIKPQLAMDVIEREAGELNERGFLRAVV